MPATTRLEAAKEDTTALVVGPESFEQFKCQRTQGRHNFETWLRQMEKTRIEYHIIPHRFGILMDFGLFGAGKVPEKKTKSQSRS